MMETEKLAEEHKRKELSAHGFSLISVTLAIAMIIVGSIYWEQEDCKLGASSYLYYGGVFSLTINVLGLATSVAKWLALKDGKISLSERRILWLLGCTSSTIVICDVVVIIWGSIVVFSSYSGWTYEDKESDNYCHKTPMMFAFILLLIKWLLVPCMLVVGCIMACCCPKQRQAQAIVEE